jgi:integrase/recombinase XerD
MRTQDAKTKSNDSLHMVITDTIKLWRRAHLTYDQTRHVAKAARRALALTAPETRTHVVARLSQEEERRLIAQAYRMPGVRGLLIKTLFQTGARVSEFVNIRAADVYFDEQMLLLAHAKGGKQRYVPLLPELAQELRTYLCDRTLSAPFQN